MNIRQLVNAALNVDAARRHLRAADDHYSRVVNSVTPAQWRAAIEQIADPMVRAKVACIVWWDYVAERWGGSKELAALMATYELAKDPKPFAVAEALRSIGYAAHTATRRSKPIGEGGGAK